MIEEQNRNLETEYIEKQLELQKQIDFANAVHPESVKNVAGVDLAYWKEDDGAHGPEKYIEAHICTDETINKRLERT